jgi:response regulator RpfG family c-di-GMP phosphodiesterase
VIEELEEDNVEIRLVISDWLMPEMKGDDFLILVHSSLPKTAKIMLTGQADHKAIERARREANLHRYLPKPWGEAELIEAIHSGNYAL